jgi:hypothetical protein
MDECPIHHVGSYGKTWYKHVITPNPKSIEKLGPTAAEVLG